MTRSAADLLFQPASIAVYGASSDPEKLSGRPLAYLRSLGYEGEIFAVNPKRTEVQGVAAYPTIGDVPSKVDLAIIVVPAASVIDAVEQCAAAGVGAVTIFASGFSEVVDNVETRALQERIASVSRSSGMRILGPNGLGSFALPSRAFATFSTAFDSPGDVPDSPIALVTQSGAVGTFLYSNMTSVGLGVRYFANPGNQVDISVTEVLTSLAERDDVEVLMGHLEQFTDEENLERLAARAAELRKPLLLLKAGRTDAGARAIGAHTGSVAGDDARFNQILTQHGAIRAESMVEMTDLALACSNSRAFAGRRLTIVTQSGGAGALATDIAVASGLDVQPWSEEARADVADVVPYFGSTANPLDLTGAMINDPSILDRALAIAGSSDECDVVLVVVGNSDKAATELVSTCVRHYRSTTKPFFVSWTGGNGRARQDLLAAGIPTFIDPVPAVRAIARVALR